MMAYEKRILAYVDILGWKAACCSKEPSVLARVERAMNDIHSVASQYSAETKRRLAETADTLVHPLHVHVQWGAFSDNFVVSMPESFGVRLLIPVADICRRLLRIGFLTRGAVTVCDLYRRHHGFWPRPCPSRRTGKKGSGISPLGRQPRSVRPA